MMNVNDQVKNPAHYQAFPLEVIKIIEIVLNECPNLSPFESYCLGSELKYRLRAGFKDDAAQDIKKAMAYKDFREDFEEEDR